MHSQQKCSSRRASPPMRRCATCRATRSTRWNAPIHCEVLAAATNSRCRWCRATLFPGDPLTDDPGTGFVHPAPGHGRQDFDSWMANARDLDARGINTAIPYTVDENGAYTDHAPGFT